MAFLCMRFQRKGKLGQFQNIPAMVAGLRQDTDVSTMEKNTEAVQVLLGGLRLDDHFIWKERYTSDSGLAILVRTMNMLVQATDLSGKVEQEVLLGTYKWPT